MVGNAPSSSARLEVEPASLCFAPNTPKSARQVTIKVRFPCSLCARIVLPGDPSWERELELGRPVAPIAPAGPCPIPGQSGHQRPCVKWHMQNLESQIRSVQIRRPKSRHFKLTNVSPGLRLAPGMSAKFTVEFKPPKEVMEADVLDAITVWTEGCSHTLELRAACPRAQFVLSGDLDFGIVPAGSFLTREATITNTGQLPGDWTLTADGELALTVTPAQGRLDAGAQEQVSVAIKDVDAGQAATDLVLAASGGHAVKQAVKVCAVNTSLEILEADGKLVSQVRPDINISSFLLWIPARETKYACH